MLCFADEAHYKPFRVDRIGEKLRFLAVGGIAVSVQYATYWFLLRFFGECVAYSFAYIISFAANFTLSTLFTFRVKPTIRRAFGFCASHAVNYALQISLLRLFLAALIPAKIAPLPVYAVCVPINFLLVRFFLKKKSPC